MCNASDTAGRRPRLSRAGAAWGLAPMLALLVALTVALGVAPAAAQAPGAPSAWRARPLDRLDFLLGIWVGPVEPGGRQHREAWTWVNDSTLLADVCTLVRRPGASGRLAPDTLNAHTWVLQARGGQVVLIRPAEAPADGLPLRYVLVAVGPGRARFECAQAQYPQQVTYEYTMRGELLALTAGRSGGAARHGQRLMQTGR